MVRIRVLVVEDSPTVRRHLVDVLRADPGMEVVGEATDGLRATILCHKLRPNVITLDLAMPVMDGLAVTEHIMAHVPTPILIISGSMERGPVFKTYDALVAGAIEVMEKPRGDDLAEDWDQRFLAMVRMVSRIKVITHLRGRLAGQSLHAAVSSAGPPIQPVASSQRKIIAIGTSTGGPPALASVLGSLAPGFPWPILVVIHLSPCFAQAFVEWLGHQVALPVALAEEGQTLSSADGRVLVATPDRHLVVRGGVLRYTQDPPLHSCRPAVDALFFSLARERGADCTAYLLTGMGRDGAQGLLAIRTAGGTTIAEAESTAVVFGMPGEAIRLQAASRVLPLPMIGPHLARMALVETAEHRP
jgi:two-component system chemotaxis response regulator CheB